MLQDIRKNTQGTMAKVIIWLIVISFAIFGIESILLGGGSNPVAEVNGEEISPLELQQSLQTQKRQMIAMMGQNVDPALLDDERLRPQAIESLIRRKLQMQAAGELKLAVSEQEIGEVIAAMEQFQVDGHFSPEVYRNVLAGAGYTPAYFKQTMREDIRLNQLNSGLVGSEFATSAELALAARIQSEQRDIGYATILQQHFMDRDSVTDDQVAEWYAAHQEEYRTEESLDLDYILLSADDYRSPVEEEAILEAFELAKQDSEYRTQNRVSHILFAPDGDADVQARLSKAQAELDAGVEFSEVAKKYSDDVGSASKGGDLGVSSGDAFPEEMERAIAALEPGQVSAPLVTEAGTHLILVTDRQDAEPPTLDEMRGQLQESLQLQEARAELLRTTEMLKDLAFNAENLDSPAAELGLEVQRAEGVSRKQAEGLFANPTVLDAAFSPEVLDAGHNSEVIELAPDRFIVLHVREHHAPAIRSLEEVRDEVVDALADNVARQAVAAEAERALYAVNEGRSLQEYAGDQGYEWRFEPAVERSNAAIAPDILEHAFQMPAPDADGSVYDYMMTPAGDAVLIELRRVAEGDLKALDDEEKEQLRQRVAGEVGYVVYGEFLRKLRDSAEISVM